METAKWSTIPELIDQSAHENGNLAALVDGDVQWSFNELKNQNYISQRMHTE